MCEGEIVGKSLISAESHIRSLKRGPWYISQVNYFSYCQLI